MTAPAPAKTPRPVPRLVTPRPLWERHQLFQEPVYPAGLEPFEEDDGEDEEPAIITP